MEVVFELGSTVPRIEILLPKDQPELLGALEKVREAYGRTRQHIAHVVVEAGNSLALPRHGYIYFDDEEEEEDVLNVNFEGAYYLYLKRDARAVSVYLVGVGLKVIGDISHVIFTGRA
jgi:hypothetical protein